MPRTVRSCPSAVQAISRTDVANHLSIEQLRESFRPETVRVLFVGESPPAAGTFFYAADSELYRSTREAFADAFPNWNDGETFLERFSRSGCYLDDLCHEPVNQYDARDRESRRMRLQARRDNEARLAVTIAGSRPLVVIVLLKAIARNVARALAAANCSDIETFVVTYPSRWHLHRVAYRRELATILRDLADRGVLLTLA